MLCFHRYDSPVLSQPYPSSRNTGQGAQWAGMGLELLELYPVFAHSMYTAEEAFVSFGAGWSLLSELRKARESSRINEAQLSQPCTTAMQLALVDLLRSWGIRPSLVCGHSSGEIAAAYAAGVLTSDDALRVAYFRGHAARLLKANNPHLNGGVLAVGLSESDARQFVDPEAEQVGIACINSPSSVTLSGDRDALQRIHDQLDDDGIFNRLLSVDVAYHSYHMERVREIYASDIKTIVPRPVKEGIYFVSSVTGESIRGDEMTSSYWTQNLLSTVCFSDALKGVLQASSPGGQVIDSLNYLVEIGPHSALRGPIIETLRTSSNLASSATYMSMIKRGENAATTSLSLAGQLFSNGVKIDFTAANDPSRKLSNQVMTGLPPYNWHHKTHHWNESRRSASYRFRQFPRHDLLGTPVMDYIDSQPMWRNYLRISELPWLKDHSTQGQAVFPAAGYITMALEALKQCAMTGHGWRNLCVHFRDVVISGPLLVSDDPLGVEAFIELRPCYYSAREYSGNWKEFRVFSCTPQGVSTQHFQGLVETRPAEHEDLSSPGWVSTRKESTTVPFRTIDAGKWYKDMRSVGFEYAGPFGNISSISATALGSRCSVTIPDVQSSMPSKHQESHIIHPSTLDCCLCQSPVPGITAAGGLQDPAVVTAIQDLQILTEITAAPGQTLAVEGQVKPFGVGKHSADVVVFESDSERGRPSIQASGLVYTVLPSSQRVTDIDDASSRSMCHRLVWGVDPSCSQTASVLDHCRLVSNPRPEQHLKSVCDPFCKSIIAETLKGLSAAEKEKVSGYRKCLLDWMHAQPSDSIFQVTDEAKETVKAAGAVGEWVVHVGSHLRQIVLGEVDPLSVFLHDDLLYRIYFEDENTARCNAHLVNFVKLAKFKNPGIRILEVGAGTGSLTLPLMEAIFNEQDAHPSMVANWGQYVFSDISTGFMSRARERLAQYARFIDFKKFDIESPPRRARAWSCHPLTSLLGVM